MNSSLFHRDVQAFIDENLHCDISKLIFKGSPFKDISIQELAIQIESKQRSQKKLPSWFMTKDIYYPNKLNIEQTSSELTANYKAGLLSGATLLDLTGGFGVDSYAFSKKFKQVVHCEIDLELSKIAQYNFKLLNALNIKVVNLDGLEYLKGPPHTYDWLYIDPSRRDQHKAKVFMLKDCQPNITENLDMLFKHTENILLKGSPLLDISAALKELDHVKEVVVIAVQNEVKEMLFALKKSYNGPVNIKTINLLNTDDQIFNGVYNMSPVATYSAPLNYLYEPNAAILKAGLFNEVSNELNVFKLHDNSHLYTTKELINFPGRRFKIKEVMAYDKKKLKTAVSNNKANITRRNFKDSVAQIRKKTGIKEGGDSYLLFTTNLANKPIVIICEKI